MGIDSIQPLLRGNNLSTRVAIQIEQMIRNGELKIGEKIPAQHVLCERFQVSRTVIREATKYLMAKGLLISQAGNGTYVRRVESSDVANYLGLHISTQHIPASIDEIFEIRRILEIQIVQFAADRANEKNIIALESNLKELKELLDSPDEFAKKDLDFHILIARATQNPLFEIMLNPLIEPLLEVIRLALNNKGTGEEGIYFHRQILEQIKSQNKGGAARDMERHLIQSQHAVLKAIEIMRTEKEKMKVEMN
jgi:GntR family transcriptional repressor for pyruvate dehydrogenase complex